MNGRNFVRLVQLAPGAHEGLPNSLASGTRPDDRRQTSAISINGALDNQNNQLIDGMDNNERAIGTIGVKPSIDAIAEVKVQTSNYTAETGRTAGGVVNILTKSGTNNFRGSAFEFCPQRSFRREELLRRDQARCSASINIGGSLGGPLARRSDVLLRRLRRVPADAGRHQRDHRADGPDAQRRLRRVVRRHPRSAGGARAVSQQPDSGQPVRPDRDEVHGALSGADQRRPGQQLRRASPSARRTARRPTSASTTGSTTAMSMFARYSYNNVDTFTPSACPPTADGIEPGCGGGLAFPGPNITKAHGVQAQLRARPFGLADLRIQGRLPQGRHPVVAAQLRHEPEPAVRHPGRECR